MWSTVKPLLISFVVEEVPYCVSPAATVAYTYNHLYERNKIKAFSIGFAGFIISGSKLGAMQIDQEAGIGNIET